MGFIIYGIISVLLIVSSYLFNINKLTQTKGKIALLSILEGLISAGIIYLIFLVGIFRYFSDVVIAILFTSVAILIYTFLVKGRDADWDLQNENIKNNLLLFALVVLPFLLAMTILRFTNPFLQLFISLSVPFIVIFLHRFTQKKFKNPFSRLKANFELMSDFSYILLFLVVALFIASPLIFQTPAYPLKSMLNLEDTASYYSFEDYPFDYDINFEATVLFEEEFELENDQLILDYLVEDNLLYLYTEYNMYVYNMDTNNVEKTVIKNLSGTARYNDTIPWGEYFLSQDSSLDDTHGYSSVYIDENNIRYSYHYDQVYGHVYYDVRNLSTNEDILTAEYKGDHNAQLTNFGDFIVALEVGYLDTGVIEFWNKDFTIDSVTKIYRDDFFYTTAKYSEEYVPGYYVNEDSIEYLFVTTQSDIAHITLVSTYMKDVELNLPFYSISGLYFIPYIILALFIPLSDYRKHITEISFESQTFKKKEPEKDNRNPFDY